MNPSSLKALVDQHAAGPTASAMGMAPPSEDMDDEDMEGEEEPEAAASGAERGNELITEWGEFGQTLLEEADEIHDLAQDVGADLLLKEVPDDAMKAVGKAVDGMPDELSMGLAKYVSALSPEDCQSVSMALAAKIGEDKADENLLYVFLHQAAQYAKEEIDVDEDFNESEEEEEEDDNDEADAGDEAGGPPAGDAPPAGAA